ncbi:hypothetical protein CYY_006710 [Polysphondylium violaceum]|uniref:SCP domain-containing protein n=1 Tax=Polysphondylium violaceum TaxID=133409 RepID=A0A8J4PQ61_9MYCE|nr:hypothetical protein CYY_006710 [Polysphondylium violaceum]
MYTIKSTCLTIFVILISIVVINAQTNPSLHLSLVNAERARVGLKPLLLSPCLMASAQVQSNYQSSINTMTHSSPLGGLFERTRPFGVACNSVAENVAYGYKDDASVMKGWMNSSGHRANILGQFTLFGVAVSKDNNGDLYWTQQFARGTCNRNNSTAPAN